MMVCNQCNSVVPDGAAVCPCCQAAVTAPPAKEAQLPAKYRPLGAWAYFGYNLLFSIPVLNIILLLVFSFSNRNINRRNYARSFWCGLLVVLILTGMIV